MIASVGAEGIYCVFHCVLGVSSRKCNVKCLRGNRNTKPTPPCKKNKVLKTFDFFDMV